MITMMRRFLFREVSLMGRPVGCRETELSQIKTIVELSQEGKSRPDIAEKSGVSEYTVWKYQKDFDLL